MTSPLPTAQQAIEDRLNQRGFKIFAAIDQAAEAQNVGLTLKPTVLLIFGNPKVGTLLMQEDDQVAFELPIKLLLVAEGDHTKALYRDPHDFPNATKLSEAGQQIIANMANLYQSVLADL
ncbi:DUF302 domain-containing protein [Limosilactobacillus fermentum]|uniref:DUF302 domain-containing protein n=1 Tax=Limosilactobacillus fermentum TaxID=1613 RepID=UPI002857AF8A|nr:DUF302 domain-containing protein [Limosilactobacillus fermentum]MDR7662547.1 DUF302 domain-containing protein [Limosilactobacillus fermentum]